MSYSKGSTLATITDHSKALRTKQWPTQKLLTPLGVWEFNISYLILHIANRLPTSAPPVNNQLVLEWVSKPSLGALYQLIQSVLGVFYGNLLEFMQLFIYRSWL